MRFIENMAEAAGVNMIEVADVNMAEVADVNMAEVADVNMAEVGVNMAEVGVNMAEVGVNMAEVGVNMAEASSATTIAAQKENMAEASSATTIAAQKENMAEASSATTIAAQKENMAEASSATTIAAQKVVTIADIWEAHKLLKSRLHHTPLTASRTLHDLTGAHIYLKAENMQRSGSFKVRGASYRLSCLSEQEYRSGVIAASAGNHAQGVAIAAAQYNIPCTIVMPETAPLAKVTATQSYGANVVLHGFTYDDAYQHCLDLHKQSGATFIHAFDDPKVIAGQGTLGLEMLSDLPDADAIVVPIGGGGLIAGIAIAARALRPDITIIGVQAAGAAGCRNSLDAGEVCTLPAIATIADGIAVKRPGALTFSIIQRLVDDVVLVNDEAIISAVLLLMERNKMLVEGAGAVGVAALLSGTIKLPGKKVLVPLTGGNIDINLVSRFIEHGLAAAGRYFVIHTRLTDRPGELMRLLNIIAEMRINVIDVRHQRISSRLPIMQREETLTLETRDRAQCEQLLQRLRIAGYVVEEAQSLE